MALVYEYCPSNIPYHTYTFVRANDLIGKTGFRSYFGYLDNELYCGNVVVDIDGGLDAVKQAHDILVKSDIIHSIWISGGKGYHINIACKPMMGPDVPYSVKVWIKTTFGAIPGVDTSMIHAKGLIRLPETIHHKTGKRKTLILDYGTDDSNDADIPLIQEPAKIIENSTQELYFAVKRVNFYLRNPPEKGTRHKTLWRLLKGLHDAGVEHVYADHIIRLVNNSWPDPKSDMEVLKLIKSVYGS